MSGPIPAGSPSVSARGSAISIPTYIPDLFALDERLATQPLQICLRCLLEALGGEGLARLLLDRCVSFGILLGADRPHLHTMSGHFRRRQLADRHGVEHLLQFWVQIAANDLVAHDRSRRARRGKPVLAALEARAQRLRLLALGIDRRLCA